MSFINTDLYSDVFTGCHEIFRDFIDNSEIVKRKLNPPTACVTWNKETNKFQISVDPEFWDELSFIEQCFIVAHEVCHISYKHLIRFYDHPKEDRQILNVAMDLFVNHYISNKIIDRKLLGPKFDEFCWLDTVFDEMKTIPKTYIGQSTEFYFNKLKESVVPVMICSFDPFPMGGDDEGETMPLPQEAIDKINEIWEENGFKTDPKGGEEQDLESEMEKKMQQAGSSSLGAEHGVVVKKKKAKKKWESVIKEWVRGKIQIVTKTAKRWGYVDRRYQNVLKHTRFKLPSNFKCSAKEIKKEKIDIFLFLDSSGSCIHLKDRFFSAAKAIPKEFFNVRVFSFDTRVYELNLDKFVVKGGGGTSFHIIEDEIQNIITTEKTKYPDQIFVVTDGYGDRVDPEKPERWQWFLTDMSCFSYSGYYSKLIPKKCKKHNLKDFA